MQCKICGRELSGRQRLYCSGECRKDAKRKRQHEWYVANREEILERHRKYNAAHREEIRAKQKIHAIRKYMEATS